MKAVLLLSMVVFGLFACSKLSQIDISSIGSKDPVKEMSGLYAQFPTDAYPDATYNVQKTDSLVNPMLGSITFYSYYAHYEMFFHWKGDHWLFTKLINASTGEDFTGWGGGLEMMMRPKMRQMLASAGWKPTAEQEAEYRRAEEKLQRVVAAPTPEPRGAWMWKNRNNPLEQPAWR